MSFLFLILLFILLSFFFLLVIYILSYIYKGVYEGKMVSFECGFSGFSFSGFVFSMPFFLVSLMFLIFDVEIVLLTFFPISFLGGLSGVFYWLVIFIILLATIYEWLVGVLSWFSSFNN